ncbi:hypothetical protein MC885_007422 [Smutsia gigantea]|nr:hypothetical protein MC885_007422 [Smutsia gigantea]
MVVKRTTNITALTDCSANANRGWKDLHHRSPSVLCPDTCNAQSHKQCLVKTDRALECTCLPGYQEDDSGICQECAFGYSGVNCEDKFQLILTIVGSIAGILILILLSSLIFTVRSKNKKKPLEAQHLIENDFQNLRLQQTTNFNDLGAPGSIFPKIRTTNLRQGQPQNPYSNERGMPRLDY